MTKRKLLRLTESLYNVPHLISREGFQSITNYLDARNAGLISSYDFEAPDDEDQPFDTEAGVGVLSIQGPLTYKSTLFQSICGGCSYESLQEQAEEMVAAGIKTIVMDIDSGGGSAYSAFESAEEVRNLCDANGVKLLAYIDGNACSAAYAWACVADEVVANPYAEVGSIGVLIALMNDSEALKQAGIQRTFVTDGTDKVPYADDGSWREGFIEDLQSKVADLGDAFRAHVSKYTGVSTEDLKATNAKVYSAQDGLAMGLVNQIMTRSQFVNYVVGQQGAPNA